MLAKDAHQYREAWKAHVRELGNMYLDSGQSYEQWMTFRDDLFLLIERATLSNFPPIPPAGVLPLSCANDPHVLAQAVAA